MTRLKKMLADTGGATAIEYAVLASLIAVACVGAFMTLRDANGEQFNEIENSM